jgi:hypothetical protein
MGVLGYALIILMSASQRFSQLHTVVYRKTVVKQLMIELSERPLFLIDGYFLCVKVVHFSCHQ